ncbi:hypothetical protein GF386_00190 [Candidatus Pacearchaeota archaeon]|nr:hypothetical protein [Candidatus Pacearchaeota archaeon]MBD3282701.1 hypothetical protein [Candidatus Pacearchaeota archaeon]
MSIKKKENMSKKSQVTVFVIISILILVVIILLIYLQRENITNIFVGKPPLNEIENCLLKSSEEGINILEVQGGSIDPELYYMYQGNRVEYLCYTEENYKRCVMQKPLLKQSVERELENYMNPIIKNCIYSMKDALEKDGYTVSMKEPELDIEIIPETVLISLELDLSIEKNNRETYKSIRTAVDSKLYEFTMITSSILNWEARYGDSETMDYMMNFPNLKVEKKTKSDGTKVYILTDRKTDEKFMFSTRSVAFPPGLVEIRNPVKNQNSK